jgi:cytochrome o ubiquinol oxidase subunit I
VTPVVSERDPFWVAKQAKAKPGKPAYEDIVMPRNAGASIIIAAFALTFGFAMIWHIWWLAIVGLLGIILTLIVRATSDETNYTLKAAEVAKLEADFSARKGVA